MKIAFFVEVFPSLSQTFILNQITGLINQGHEVDIYAEFKGDSHQIHSDVEKYDLLEKIYYQPQTPLQRLNRVWQACFLFLRYFFVAPSLVIRSINIFKHGRFAASLRLLYAIIPFVKRNPQYDIIMCHFGLLGLKAMRLREIGAIDGKLITAFHGVDMSQNLKLLGENLYAPLFELGDVFLPISHYWKNRLIELGCDPNKITVHRMGIDSDKFKFVPRRLLDQETLKIISVSRLTEKKGLEFGIRAVAMLIERGIDLEYIIVGDGDCKQSLQNLVQQLGIAHAVKLVGPKEHSEVLKLLEQSHILLAPSVTAKDGNQEGIPVVLMEAMASGLPVVSTYHSGIPELVEDNVSGLLAPERDASALAEKLCFLIQNSEKWTNFEKAGRIRVEQEFSIDALNKKLVDICQQVLSTNR